MLFFPAMRTKSVWAPEGRLPKLQVTLKAAGTIASRVKFFPAAESFDCGFCYLCLSAISSAEGARENYGGPARKYGVSTQ